MSSSKKSILFILPSPNGGGAERVVLNILQHLSREKFIPSLLLLSREGPLADEIPDDVKVIDLKTKHARYAIFKIIKAIHTLSPDIVFSAFGYLNLIISCFIPLFKKEIHFIARESNTVSIKNPQEKFPRLFNWLYRRFYKNFELIIAQSEYMKNDLVVNYEIAKQKIHVIYNPVNVAKIRAYSQETPTSYPIKNRVNLLCVGRLNYQKGLDRLLHAMAQLDSTFHLSILGDGSLLQELKQLSHDLNITDRVSFLGYQSNPYSYMSQADLLILPSRFEGLPNVVLEANSCGLPVVAFNSPGGTAEIINDKINGFLVQDGDIELLATTIHLASKFPFEKQLIKNTIITSYNIDKVIKEYEDIFQTI
ncbi:MAG: glycosyltransferase [Campylobacterota bacterium]|nr:glycosyltransferase [Campylobacterota bacterium]